MPAGFQRAVQALQMSGHRIARGMEQGEVGPDAIIAGIAVDMVKAGQAGGERAGGKLAGGRPRGPAPW